jgi:hypothetical protein
MLIARRIELAKFGLQLLVGNADTMLILMRHAVSQKRPCTDHQKHASDDGGSGEHNTRAAEWGVEVHP